ncbi:hypothetical protein CRG98_000212 [Punica granatum]|uniref:Uncharacterized protein n=1 Tax=Punica granatum TaxID=22663 RepID=A0A2I0LFD2_PUNGR|nr:hypothetical protein CRG98_000212 [Punica granatum]
MKSSRNRFRNSEKFRDRLENGKNGRIGLDPDWPSWAAGRPGWAAARRLDRSATYADSEKMGTDPVSRKTKQRGRRGRARRFAGGGRGFRRPCRRSSGGTVVVRGSNRGARVSELGDRDEPRETIEPPVFLACELRESRGNLRVVGVRRLFIEYGDAWADYDEFRNPPQQHGVRVDVDMSSAEMNVVRDCIANRLWCAERGGQ